MACPANQQCANGACVAKSVCGNGQQENGETCEQGATKSCKELVPNKPVGTAHCQLDCKGYDASQCQNAAALCGNGVVDANVEKCEQGTTTACQKLLPDKPVGTATCQPDCQGWNTTFCKTKGSLCGDGTWESEWELCEKGAVKPCKELSAVKPVGNAVCQNNCQGYNTGGCKTVASLCGNGSVESEWEKCDKGFSQSCQYLVPDKPVGMAPCQSDCQGYDTSACHAAVCGNGIKEADEFCDDKGKPCNMLMPDKPVGGAPCQSDCKGYDTSGCKTIASLCGNGFLESNWEKCDKGFTKKCALLTPDTPVGIAQCKPDCQGWDTSSCKK